MSSSATPIRPSSKVGERFAPLLAATPDLHMLPDARALGAWVADSTTSWSDKDWQKVLPLDMSMVYSAWSKPRASKQEHHKKLMRQMQQKADAYKRRSVWENIEIQEECGLPYVTKDWGGVDDLFEKIYELDDFETDADPDNDQSKMLQSMFVRLRALQAPPAALMKLAGFIRSQSKIILQVDWWNKNCLEWFGTFIKAIDDDCMVSWVREHRQCFFGWEIQAQRPILNKMMGISDPQAMSAVLDISELKFFSSSGSHVIDKLFETSAPELLLQSIQSTAWFRKASSEEKWSMIHFMGNKVDRVPPNSPSSVWFVELCKQFISTSPESKIKPLIGSTPFQVAFIKPLLSLSPSVVFDTVGQSDMSAKTKNMIWECVLSQSGKDVNPKAQLLARHLDPADLPSFLQYVCGPSKKNKTTDFVLANAILQHRSSQEATTCLLALMSQHLHHHDCQFLASLCQRQDLDNQIQAASAHPSPQKRKI